MPDFPNPYPGLTPDRKLTDRELARTIRLALAAELEAIHLYEAQADATDNALAKEVLQDIANEERVHAGEFQRLLKILLADEQGYLDEGAEEVDEMAAEVGGGEAPAEEAGEEEAPAPSGGAPTIGDLKE